MGKRLGTKILRIALVATLCWGGVACSGSTPEHAAPPTEPAAVDCENLRGGRACRVVELDSDLSIRYAIVRPRVGNTTAATLVDFGGPGSSLFGQDWPGESLQLIADAMRTNVVALEEPWVNVEYPGGCRAAAAQWLRSLHDSITSDARAFVSKCDLRSAGWGWTPANYNLAVQKVLAAESLEFRAFVGASFAGVRLSYIKAPPPTVILASPYSTTGTADAYLRSRLESTQKFCANRKTATCDDFKTTPLESRSLPATAFDAGAAWIASNYQPNPTQARLAVKRGHANPELVGALSDAVTGRFGEFDVSPSTFAYFAELCPTFTAWGSIGRLPGLAGQFLREWHQICGYLDAAPAAPSNLDDRATLCVVASREDGVVPVRISRKAWASRADRFLVIPGSAHGVIDGATLNACDVSAPQP